MGVFERDVIIVGGGHNGLACAAYLAKGGLDVLVLEKRDVLGGAAATEEPWPGYRVSSASYVVSLMPPRIVRELDLKRFGYQVSIVTPDYFVPFPDGTSLTLWGDVARDAENIAKLDPADAERYVAFDRYFERVARLLKDLLFVIPPNLNLRELPKWAATAGRFRKWSGRDVHEAVRLFTMSAADFLDEWFRDDRVKGALATQAIIGGWCGPMTPGSAYVLMHHWIGEVGGHRGAWGWVHGGMGGVTAAMARSAEAAGAELRTGAEVERIAINASGRAVGVALADGTLIRSQRVVSGAHPVTTYLSLIGEERLPGDVVRDVKRYRSRSGSVKINVALSNLPEFPAWAGAEALHTGLVAVSPSIEYLERAWDDAKYGRMSNEPYLEVVFPTAHEPEGLAPTGKHLMLGFAQYGPYELRDGSWDDGGREEFARRALGAIGAYAPKLEGSIEHVEVLAPRDIEERFGLVGGNIMQGELAPDQMFSFRPIPNYGDYRTPVAGMYLCGSGTHPGGGVMGVPGRNAATVVLRDHKRGEFVDRIKSFGR
ncbi:MAG TPA: NAD(P)/FAD-dependent oxidoreductase [Actinomycetota bacterium]|nr:NAD(P)/FAD-dependent oxidoreductase [Actinomycetota bacterium]